MYVCNRCVKMQTIDSMSIFEFVQVGYNQRDIDEISEDIIENGWLDDEDYPVVLVNDGRKFTVVDGNHRIRAMKQACEYGWEGNITAIVIDKSVFDDVVDRFDGDVENNLFDIAEIIRGMN